MKGLFRRCRKVIKHNIHKNIKRHRKSVRNEEVGDTTNPKTGCVENSTNLMMKWQKTIENFEDDFYNFVYKIKNQRNSTNSICDNNVENIKESNAFEFGKIHIKHTPVSTIENIFWNGNLVKQNKFNSSIDTTNLNTCEMKNIIKPNERNFEKPKSSNCVDSNVQILSENEKQLKIEMFNKMSLDPDGFISSFKLNSNNIPSDNLKIRNTEKQMNIPKEISYLNNNIHLSSQISKETQNVNIKKFKPNDEDLFNTIDQLLFRNSDLRSAVSKEILNDNKESDAFDHNSLSNNRSLTLARVSKEFKDLNSKIKDESLNETTEAIQKLDSLDQANNIQINKCSSDVANDSRFIEACKNNVTNESNYIQQPLLTSIKHSFQNKDSEQYITSMNQNNNPTLNSNIALATKRNYNNENAYLGNELISNINLDLVLKSFKNSEKIELEISEEFNPELDPPIICNKNENDIVENLRIRLSNPSHSGIATILKNRNIKIKRTGFGNRAKHGKIKDFEKNSTDEFNLNIYYKNLNENVPRNQKFLNTKRNDLSIPKTYRRIVKRTRTDIKCSGMTSEHQSYSKDAYLNNIDITHGNLEDTDSIEYSDAKDRSSKVKKCETVYNEIEVMKSFDYYNELQIKESKIHGQGIFTPVEIKKDTLIMEYKGEIIGKCMSDKRERFYQRMNMDSIYMFTVTEDKIIDATMTGNKARYVNHSCNPNCQSLTSMSDLSIKYCSIKDILPGEELTINYYMPVDDSDDICKCGDVNCISRITII